MEDTMNAFVSSFASTIQEVQRDPDLPSKVIFVASFFSLRILQPIRRLLQNNPNGSSSTPSVAGVSERAETHFMTPPMHYFVDWIRASENQYDARKNPTGSLPLAVAENKLMAVEMMDKIKSFRGYTKDILYYNDGTGMPAIKDALIKVLTKRVYKLSSEVPRKIQPEDICVSSGVTAILHELSMLLFNPGDAVLIPTPYYPAFDHDFWNISDVKAFGVDCLEDENPFSISLDKASLEKGYVSAMSAGKRPKALLLTNPGNPLGTVYTPEDLLKAVGWARSKGLHVIVDEIYALTVFNTNDGPDFLSIANLLNNELGDDVHCLWGMSKDFCANGLRVGVLYTQNKKLQQAIGNLSFAFQASNFVQELTAFVLKDEVFVESYISQNKLRLKKSYDVLETALNILNVPMIKAQASMFCLINLRCLLKADTFDAERELYDLLHSEAGIVLTPGQTCHCPIPGWFRVCYAWVPLDALVEFTCRLRIFIQNHMNVTLPELEYKYGIMSKKTNISSNLAVEQLESLRTSSLEEVTTHANFNKVVDDVVDTSSTSIASSIFPSVSSKSFKEGANELSPDRTKYVNSKKSPSTASESPLSTPSNTPPRRMSGLVLPSSRSKPSPLTGVTTDDVSMSVISDGNSSASVNITETTDDSTKKKKGTRKKSIKSSGINNVGKSELESPSVVSVISALSRRTSTIMSNRKSNGTNNAPMAPAENTSGSMTKTADVNSVAKSKNPSSPIGKSPRKPSSLL